MDAEGLVIMSTRLTAEELVGNSVYRKAATKNKKMEHPQSMST